MAETEYIVCPLCRFNRHITMIDFSSEITEFVQIREGKGFRSGFHKVRAFSLEEAKKNPKYKEIIEEIKGKCKQILQELK